jgi:ornithine cyclodeaminase/alanine dehydrogenase-like protein (mu-crystallin family)
VSAGPIWISEADVTSLVTLKDAHASLEQGLRWEGEGKAHNVPKALGRWPNGVMHCLGAMFPDEGFIGWKTWAITPAGGGVTYELFDANKGALLAVIEAIALGQLRTAAMTGIGTDWLAAPDADRLAIIGAGRQALAQVAAIAAVRPLKQVTVFSRGAEKRETFAATLRQNFSFEVSTVDTVESATAEASIVTLVTRAEQPFLAAAMLRKGAHLNAVGAILPTHAEFKSDVFARTDLIAVDSVADVRKNSREFIEQFGHEDSASVRSIAAVINAGVRRPAATDLSLFKSMGMGISDLSVASEVYRRAIARGMGRPIPAIQPSRIRWS